MATNLGSRANSASPSRAHFTCVSPKAPPASRVKTPIARTPGFTAKSIEALTPGRECVVRGKTTGRRLLVGYTPGCPYSPAKATDARASTLKKHTKTKHNRLSTLSTITQHRCPPPPSRYLPFSRTRALKKKAKKPSSPKAALPPLPLSVQM